MIPLTLYIHFPWCVRKCPYCDFNSHQLKQDLPEDVYIQRLITDLEQDLPLIWGRPIQAIFMGGGTPSLFSPQAIENLLSELNARLQFTPMIEITMEANPGTVEQQRFEGFRAAGINRISLGIQSFNREQLTTLGRIHDDEEAKRAITMAMNAGFNQINIDLMFGLPKQTIAQGLDDLQTALDFNPTHLSWYQLTLEPNTLFYKQPPSLPSDELIWQLQQQGQALLSTHGFKQYEVSAYARDNALCQHNLNYWQFGDYLGIGAGAHAKITNLNDNTITRYWKIKHPQQYLTQPNAIGGKTILTDHDIAFEFMLNALRLTQPIPIKLFQQRTGLDISTIQAPLQLAQAKGFMEITAQEICLTQRGYDFLNDVTELFLPA